MTQDEDPRTRSRKPAATARRQRSRSCPAGTPGSFAQPREEEAFDAAGLSQDSPDGETYPAGAPDLSQFGAEDQDSAGEPGAGRFGGTEEQMSSENASTTPGYDADASENSEAAVPSSEAEMDDVQHRRARRRAALLLRARAGRGRAAGRIGNGPAGDQGSPKDRDDEETFDAG